MTFKKFRCPFCMDGFNTRRFLLDQHMPVCVKRNDYFNKQLEPQETEEIKRRIEGSVYKIEVIEHHKFQGNAIAKDEHKGYDP